MTTDKTSEQNKSTTDKALKGVHSQTAIVVLKAGLSLVYFSLMSRLLSPDDFGLYALITAVTTILCSLSEAGMGSAVIQRKDHNKDFNSTAFTLSLAFGLFFALILFFGSGIFSRITTGKDTLSLAYKIMSVMMLLQAANNITWSLYMRKLDFFKFGILQVCSDLLSYFIGLGMAWNGFGFYSIVGAVVSSQLFLTLILACMKKYDFRIIIIRKYVKEILGYGGWLTASVITRNLTNEIDKIIIGRLLPVADLGAINRPGGFTSRISSQINGIVDTVLFPILSAIQDDKEKVARGYLKIISLVVTFSFFIAGAIGVGSKIVIDIFFGSQWENLQFILIIFSFSMSTHGFSRVSDSFFRSLGIVKKYFLARVVNWGFVVTFVIIGCQFGILGVAIGLASGTILSCWIKFMMQRKDVGVTGPEVVKTLLQALATPVIIIAFAAGCRILLPYGNYIGIVIYVVGVAITIWFFPNLYGKPFREIVIKRYLKR